MSELETATHSGLRRWGGMAAVLILIAVPVSVVAISGNLATGPRLVDDNQIYMLDRQLDDEGLASVVIEHYRYRLFEMKRLVPVYLAHKLFQVSALGTNLAAWGLYNALLGGITGCILFAFGRLVRLSMTEALLFALIVVLGEQSVLWWRNLHGEGIGLLLVALALACIPLHTRYPAYRTPLLVLFVGFATLASLAKESFIVLLPALAFVLLIEERRAHGGGWMDSLRRHRGTVSILALVCLFEIFVVYTVMGKTNYGYTGWKGFDPAQLAAIAAQFFSGDRLWLALLPVPMVVVYWLGTRGDRRNALIAVGALGTLVLAVLGPQFLLYMSSGFSGTHGADYSRFLVPSTLGLAALVVLPMAWVRMNAGSALHRILRWVTAAACCGVVLLRYETAMAEARSFVVESDDIHAFLKAVELHGDDDDLVLFVFGKHNRHGATRRMSILLEEYSGLKNLYYVPVLGGNESFKTFEYFFTGMDDPYVNHMYQATIESGGVLPSVDTVIIATDSYIDVEKPFLLQESDWFHPGEYLRYTNKRGDVAYFRPEPMPEYLESYTEHLTRATAIGMYEDGRIRVTGSAHTPEHVDRIVLRSGDIVVEPAMNAERVATPYRYYPGYSGGSIEFELEAAWPGGTPHSVSIELHAGEKLLYTGTVNIQ